MTVVGAARRVLRLALLVGTVAALAAALTGCSRSGPVAGEGRLAPSGRAVVTPSRGQPQTVSRERTLQQGDVVEVTEGTARVTLPGGGTLELRRGTTVALDEGPELRAGDLLVTSPAGSLSVRAVGAEVLVSGASRLGARLGLRTGTYQGLSTVRSAGRELAVPALREVNLPAAGLLPTEPAPLSLEGGDEWDRRFLPAVLDRLADLESRARGFTLPRGRASDPAVYRRLLPQLAGEPAFDDAAVQRFGPAGEVLVGAAIAVLGRRGTLAERLDATATFRAAGARWALVAADQQVPDLDRLVEVIDEAIDRHGAESAAEQAAPPAAGGGAGGDGAPSGTRPAPGRPGDGGGSRPGSGGGGSGGGSGGGTGSGGGGSGGGGGGSGGGGGGSGGGGGGGGGGDPGGSPGGIVDPLLSPVLDAVVGLVDQLLGGGSSTRR